MVPEAVRLGEASGGNDDANPSASASPANKEFQGNQQVLTTIASLDAILTQMKADICDTLWGEIAENDIVRREIENHNDQLKDMADSATNMSNSVVKLKKTGEQLSGQVEKLTEKCIDLEGRSKR